MSEHGSPTSYGQPESPTEEYDPQYHEEEHQHQQSKEELGPPASPDDSPDYSHEYQDVSHSQNENAPHSPDQEYPLSPEGEQLYIQSPPEQEEDVSGQTPQEEGPMSPDNYLEDQEEQERPISTDEVPQSPLENDQISEPDEPKSPEDGPHEYQEGEEEESVPKSPEEAQEHEREENEDSDNDNEKPAEVDQLMTNIFGEDSDDEEQQHEDEPRVQYEDEDGDEEGRQWDFDRIMAEKKRERSKKRKRRKDGSIDLSSNADERIRHVVQLMKDAAAEDREANNNRRPAIQKTKMLDVVRSILLRADFFEALLENDMMSAISEWLAPLPDKSLPALEIRTTLLKILSSFPNLEPGILKVSGLGRAMMLIFKHPKEIRENKIMASKLIRNWSQPIFQISADYSSVSKEERQAYDIERLPEAKRRRIEFTRESGSSRPPPPSQHNEPALGPGDPGFIGRARVPKASTSAYVYRPKPNLDGGMFRGETKNRQNPRLREFKERTKATKAERAVGVSLEGRRMD